MIALIVSLIALAFSVFAVYGIGVLSSAVLAQKKEKPKPIEVPPQEIERLYIPFENEVKFYQPTPLGYPYAN